jgi:predicted phage terminase large subunit-like protein
MTKPVSSQAASPPISPEALLEMPGLHPATMAAEASGGAWRCFPHLGVLAGKLYDVAAGRCPRLLVQMPPRHGKSCLISQYFPAWYLGTFPGRRVLLASYESDFAASWGRKARDILEEFGPSIFGVKVRSSSSAANRWDIDGHPGGMVTAGARAAITGRGMDLGIIDDGVKDADEAGSQTYRDRTWDWYLSTFSTRLHRDGAIVVVGTRWHEDDLIGRILEAQGSGGDQWEVLSLPAVAEAEEELDGFHRSIGDPLCPELIPLDMLQSIEARVGDYWWATLYQGRPYPRGGGIFRTEAIKLLEAPPPHILKVRAWDLAASVDGKKTAGLLLGKGKDGEFCVIDVVAGRWLPGDRDRVISETAELDGADVPIRIEQEPGSGGIAQIHNIARRLPGFKVEGMRVTGSKMSRADPVASTVNLGNFSIVRGNWSRGFLEELEAFPSGSFCDQVDALSLAFSFLAARRFPQPPLAAGFRPQRDADDWRNELESIQDDRRRGGDWRREFPR